MRPEPVQRKERATPGGYGGKPPGVAFIGAPTGARNAGIGAPAGDQGTGKHVTPNPPLVRQDRIRTQSRYPEDSTPDASGAGGRFRSFSRHVSASAKRDCRACRTNP